MKRIKYIMLAIVVLLACSGCEKGLEIRSKELYPILEDEQSDIIKGRLTLVGSTSMTKLSSSLAEAFMEDYPEVKFEKSDTGSGAAIKAIKEGAALIGDVSRSLSSDEQEGLESRLIAIDGIAVIVNSNNPIEDISASDLKKVFTGEITNWSDLGGKDQKITLIGREESSGTREGFESNLFIKDKAIYHAEYPESGDVISKVTSDASAIGYCSLFCVHENIKALQIDSIPIEHDTIKNGTYKITRPFIEVYLKGQENIKINAWFDFISSKKGQEIIKAEGLVAALQ